MASRSCSCPMIVLARVASEISTRRDPPGCHGALRRKIAFEDEIYGSPSGAGRRQQAPPTNGWTYWAAKHRMVALRLLLCVTLPRAPPVAAAAVCSAEHVRAAAPPIGHPVTISVALRMDELPRYQREL